MKYFISTSICKNGKSGFGHHEIHRDKPISNLEDVRGIASLIKDEENMDSVIVLGWQEFEVEK